jgi:putative glutamine amidotransferase
MAMDTRPLIGISASYHDFGDYGAVGVPRPLALAGAVPVILPRVPQALDATLDLLDGVVLAPGRDIDPRAYGQEPDPRLAPTEPERDRFELDLVPRVLERGLPVLGMCRGIQILNVALGGTLVQDLGMRPEWSEHPSDPGWSAWKQVEHASLLQEPPAPHPRHEIAVEPGSRLARALGATRAEVNSFHHQALDRVADDLAVVATAPDGVVEAIELADADVLAVQWELQEEWRIDQRFLRVFDWFVEAAAQRR